MTKNTQIAKPSWIYKNQFMPQINTKNTPFSSNVNPQLTILFLHHTHRDARNA